MAVLGLRLIKTASVSVLPEPGLEINTAVYGLCLLRVPSLHIPHYVACVRTPVTRDSRKCACMHEFSRGPSAYERQPGDPAGPGILVRRSGM